MVIKFLKNQPHESNKLLVIAKEFTDLSKDCLSVIMPYIVHGKFDSERFCKRYKLKSDTSIDFIHQTLIKCQYLKKIDYLSNVPITDLIEYAQYTEFLDLQADMHIEITKSCYLVISGCVNQSGKLIRPYKTFGESEIIYNDTKLKYAITKLPTQLLVIPEKIFIKIIQNRYAQRYNLIRYCIQTMYFFPADNIEINSKSECNDKFIYILINRNSHSYLKLTDKSLSIWKMIDGSHDLTNIINSYGNKNVEAEIVDLLYKFIKLRFIKVRDEFLVVDKTQTSRRDRNINLLKRIFTFQYNIYHADLILDAFNRKTAKYIFNPYMLIIYFAIAITGFCIFTFKASSGFAILKEHKSPMIYLISYLLFIFTIPLHEFAHAVTTKFFGRNVGAMGIAWLWITPVAFTDTTDMWLASRSERAIVNIAGMCLNFFFASLAMIIYLLVGTGTPGLILLTFAVLSYISVIFNLNPYLEFDGYYLLMDLLDCSNLKSKAVRWLIKKSKYTFTNVNLMIRYKNEIIYWLACLLYAFVSFILIYMIQNYLISIFFPEYHVSYFYHLLRFFIPVILVVLSFYTAFNSSEDI